MKRGYTHRRTTARMLAAQALRDDLAEHVSNEGSLASYARAHAVTERYVQMVWRRIRADLGVQAV